MTKLKQMKNNKKMFWKDARPYPFWDINPITSYAQTKNRHPKNSPRGVMLQKWQ